MLIHRIKLVRIALLVALLSSAFAVGTRARPTDSDAALTVTALYHVKDVLYLHKTLTRDDRDNAMSAVDAAIQIITDYENDSH